jgi:hypothetical protein
VAGVGDVDGDGVPDLLVAARAQDVSVNGVQGEVFLFSGATGLLLRTLDDPTPQAGALFGYAVAGLGDVDGDGVPDVLIGAELQNVGGNVSQGQAFVFSGATGLLLHTLDDHTPQAFADFGLALAGVGDVNGDGVPDLAVGAPQQTVGMNQNQGQAFIFDGSNGLLILTLNDPVPKAAAQFGEFLARLGDVNGDGVPDLLVGAPFQTVGANTDQGQAYVFSGATGLRLLTINDPTPQAFAAFGGPVAGLGNVNGDGVPDFVIGAGGQTVGANPGQDQVFLFKSPSKGQFAVFDPQLTITLKPGANDDRFTLKARFALGNISNGIHPVKEAVTIRIGTFKTTIPDAPSWPRLLVFASRGVSQVSL